MTMRTTARLLGVALLSLGLLAGCASTSETDNAAFAAEQAIADAKAATAEAKALNYEWRDTGSLIKQAEEKQNRPAVYPMMQNQPLPANIQ